MDVALKPFPPGTDVEIFPDSNWTGSDEPQQGAITLGSAITLATSSAGDDIIDTSGAHGLVAGDRVRFTALTGGTGLTVDKTYYVIAANLASTTFQVSPVLGGTAVNFSSNITAGTAKKISGSGAPVGASVDRDTVGADGTLTVTVSAAGDYWAHAIVDERDRYIRFKAGADQAEGHGASRADLATLQDEVDAIDAADYNLAGAHADRPVAGTAGRLYFETDSGITFRDSGAAWVAVSDGVISKSADETVNNSSTVQDDDHLKFPVEANKKYAVELMLDCVGASANADFKTGWSLPASASHKWQLAANMQGVGVGVSPAAVNTTTISFGGISGEFLVIARGLIIVGATPGTAQFQWAQNSATLEDSTLKAGSLLRVRPVG